MAVKTEKDLSQGSRALWLKAMAAIELQNFDYAISLLQELLKQEPEFLTGRQLLRRAEVTKTKSAKKSFFNISTAPIGVMKAQREMKTDPKRAVEMLEDVLETEPYNPQANLLLKEAAVAAGVNGVVKLLIFMVVGIGILSDTGGFASLVRAHHNRLIGSGHAARG